MEQSELLAELNRLASDRGLGSISKTALLNANSYAEEQIKYGFANGKSAEELVVISLERQVSSLKKQNEEKLKEAQESLLDVAE